MSRAEKDLFNDTTEDDEPLPDDAVADMITIKIKFPTSTYRLEVVPEETIRNIRKKCSKWNEGNLPKLKFDGETLDDESTLKDYDIESGDMLEAKN
jgi:hypothetical protein